MVVLGPLGFTPCGVFLCSLGNSEAISNCNGLALQLRKVLLLNTHVVELIQFVCLYGLQLEYLVSLGEAQLPSLLLLVKSGLLLGF